MEHSPSASNVDSPSVAVCPPPDAATQTPTERWSQGLDWPTALWLGGLHVGVFAAPFFFTWKALLLAFVLSWLSGGLGVCLGYHRLLTHGSFETYQFLRRTLALLGMMAGEGPPVTWVATHRKHHYFSDQADDPHSPRHGRWWSHVLWMLPSHGSDEWAGIYRRYAPDLLRDPFMRFLNRTFLLWQLAAAAILYLAGWLLWDVMTGVSFVVYGMFVRLVYVMHVTWLINSASHIWGYRNYDTDDDSRNLWWVALLSYGEGWHNNHHAFQRVARHGHRRWEFDATYATICLMKRLGLAWNIVDDSGRRS
jgi:stearoyl-CoA desaturase (delta-9 desaturase)